MLKKLFKKCVFSEERLDIEKLLTEVIQHWKLLRKVQVDQNKQNNKEIGNIGKVERKEKNGFKNVTKRYMRKK